MPEAVDDAKWNEMYATYAEDRNEIGIREWFAQTEHAWAYQTLVGRMLEAARTGYWEAPTEVVANLAEDLANSIQAVGAACNALICNNAALLDYALEHLDAAPAVALAQAIAEARGEAPTETLAAAPEAADAAEADLDAAPEAAPEAAEAPEEPAESEAVPEETTSEEVQGYEMTERSIQATVMSEDRALMVMRIGFLAVAFVLLTGWVGARSRGRPSSSGSTP